jgi:DNA-binding transcriptional LysR family regulator
MQLTEVRSFLTLAEQSHFGRAARLLHLSQPALSKQIRRLEEELGGPLFTRGRTGAQLTSMGKEVLPGARVLIADGDRLIGYARQVARGETGNLRIGFGHHTMDLVPRLIVRLRKSFPKVEISIRDMSTTEQVEGLRSHRIDLGFVRLPVKDKSLQTLPVLEDRLLLVSGQTMGLPADLTLASCREQPFVLISRERSPTLARHILDLCAKHRFHPRIVQEVMESTTAMALVRAGLGVSVISQSFATARFAGVRFHPLADAEAVWSVGAAWRTDDSNPILHRFLSMVKQEVRKR